MFLHTYLKSLLIISVIMFGFNLPSAQAAVGGGETQTVTSTTSTTHHETFTDTFLSSVRMDDFLTRITAQLAGGPILFDQSFNLHISDAIVQSAVANAQNILNAAGAATISGPNLIFSQEDFLGSVTNFLGEQFNHDETSVTTTTTIGPATILIGDDQSQTFFVPGGALNINTHTHTESFIDRSYQDQHSYLTSEHYDLTGRL